MKNIFKNLTDTDLIKMITNIKTQDHKKITKFSGTITSEDVFPPEFLNRNFINENNVYNLCHVGDYISMIFNYRDGIVKSDTIQKIVTDINGIWFFTKNVFNPINIKEYVVAPIDFYYDPKVDFYVGDKPIDLNK